MSRLVLADGNFAVKRRGREPAASITTLDLLAYFGTSVAGSPNLVSAAALTQTGTVPFTANYATVTPAVNSLAPAGLVDVADQTIMFVARTSQVGGNFSPIVTAYPGSVGLMIGLSNSYLRIHAAGFGSILNYNMAGGYGATWCFYSVILDSGHATPIRWKNWTQNNAGTGGTASGNRVSTGTPLTIGGHSIATTGVFTSDIPYVARATSILSEAADGEIDSCYQSARLSLLSRGIVGV